MSRAAPSLPRRTVGRHLALLVAAGARRRVRPRSSGRAHPAAIELDTSQGCASCQPARGARGVRAGARRTAPTFPITYRDYLGRNHVDAQPAFTARQRAYASLRGEHVSTPQAIVNGEPSMIRSDRTPWNGPAPGPATSPIQVPVRSCEEGTGSASMSARAPDRTPRPSSGFSAVMRRRRIAIGGGENKGQVFDYINVVRGMHRIGPWAGHAAHFEVPRHAAQVADADSYVVVLQGGIEGRPSRILGAAKAPGLLKRAGLLKRSDSV